MRLLRAIETLQRGLEIAFGVDQEIRGDHHLVVLGHAFLDLCDNPPWRRRDVCDLEPRDLSTEVSGVSSRSGTRSSNDAGKVTEHYARNYGVELDPETEVVSTIGAKEGLAHLMWVLVERTLDPLGPSQPGSSTTTW